MTAFHRWRPPIKNTTRNAASRFPRALHRTPLCCIAIGPPWLLRAGQHIRVDIVLRAIPARLAYGCEWLSDVMACAGCVALAWMGIVMTFKSYASGAIQIKSVVIPEWWVMAPLPIAFALLAIEFAFRMWRLAHGPKEPRSDAVSAA